MNKIVTVKLTEEEHEEFTRACKKEGTFRPFFARKAIMDKVEKINNNRKGEM